MGKVLIYYYLFLNMVNSVDIGISDIEQVHFLQIIVKKWIRVPYKSLNIS